MTDPILLPLRAMSNVVEITPAIARQIVALGAEPPTVNERLTEEANRPPVADDEAALAALESIITRGSNTVTFSACNNTYCGPRAASTAILTAIKAGKVPGVMYAPYAEAHMQRQCSDIAAKDAALAKRHQQAKEMHAEISRLKADLAAERHRADLAVDARSTAEDQLSSELAEMTERAEKAEAARKVHDALQFNGKDEYDEDGMLQNALAALEKQP